jgi:ABC-2 type transport system permease protein
VFAAYAALSVALAAGVYLISLDRDLGGGLLQSRPGPATAVASLRSPLALSWRRHRGALVSWVIGLAALGALLGAAAGNLDTQLDTAAFRQLSAELGGGSPGDVFFRLVLYVLAQIGAAFAIATTLRMRTDEISHLADPLLAAPVTRLRWAAGQLGIAVAGTAVVLAGLGLGAGLTYGAGQGDVLGQAARLTATTLSYLPACLVLAGLATALFGWAPRLAVPVTWAALALVILADLLGEFRLVTGALLDLSPFQYTVRSLASATQTATALVVLSLIAAALGAVGLLGFGRRDLA